MRIVKKVVGEIGADLKPPAGFGVYEGGDKSTREAVDEAFRRAKEDLALTSFNHVHPFLQKQAEQRVKCMRISVLMDTKFRLLQIKNLDGFISETGEEIYKKSLKTVKKIEDYQKIHELQNEKNWLENVKANTKKCIFNRFVETPDLIKDIDQELLQLIKNQDEESKKDVESVDIYKNSAW